MVAPLALFLASALGANTLSNRNRKKTLNSARNLLTPVPRVTDSYVDSEPMLLDPRKSGGKGVYPISKKYEDDSNVEEDLNDRLIKQNLEENVGEIPITTKRRQLLLGSQQLGGLENKETAERFLREQQYPRMTNLLDMAKTDNQSMDTVRDLIALKSQEELGIEGTQKGPNTTQSLWTTGKGENQQVFREVYENGKRFFDGPTGRLTYDEVIDKYGDILPTTAGGFDGGSKSFTSRKQFADDVTDISDIDISLNNLEEYFGGVKDTNTGLKRLGDELSSAIKTLLGDEKYTNAEVLLGIARSRLQRQIGSNRLAIVGGGVMTEKDAWRVIQGLGGDINSLQNPEVLRKALKDMYEINLRKRDNLVTLYNIGITDLGYERDYRRKRKTGKFNEQTEKYTYDHILDDIFGKDYQQQEDLTDLIDGEG
tara:strand:+ start:2327 stop:3604 length:1278 start_codon:yes stop_codon:yes gene_type:complete